MDKSQKNRIPVGVQFFERIREENIPYVDKTEYIWKLVHNGKAFFLLRPRRSGKSLLVSAMKAYFQGKKELFHGTFIGQMEKEWEPCPVLLITIHSLSLNQQEMLQGSFQFDLIKFARQYGLAFDKSQPLGVMFSRLIQDAWHKTGKQVAVLIDDDRTMHDFCLKANHETMAHYRRFFELLQENDKYLKFVFSVSTCGRESMPVIHEMHYLKDISMDPEYAGICGFTEEELSDNYAEEIAYFASENQITVEECRKQITRKYFGYRYCAGAERVCNPFSFLCMLREGESGQYWRSSRTPDFMMQIFKDSRYSLEHMMNGIKAEAGQLMDYGSDEMIPVFYQTGFLTIDGYDSSENTYIVRIPDQEVRNELIYASEPLYFDSGNSLYQFIFDFQDYMIKEGPLLAVKKFMQLFQVNDWAKMKKESYPQYVKDQLMILAEEPHFLKIENLDADALFLAYEDKDYAAVFGFTMDESAESAIAKIDEKDYAFSYETDPQRIYKIGVNFSSKKRNVDKWKVKE